ncbi:MAG: hypothetical protein MJZ11_08255 [Lachnospiraceae bacterium]|nr:hypothetical protein [Lachnospiraceae bacterium]
MDVIIVVYKKNGSNWIRSELYVGGFAYINFERNYINVSTDGSNSVDWQHIPFEKIECSVDLKHFTVYTKEN